MKRSGRLLTVWIVAAVCGCFMAAHGNSGLPASSDQNRAENKPSPTASPSRKMLRRRSAEPPDPVRRKEAEVLWQVRLNGRLSAAPVITNHLVLAVTDTGTVNAFDNRTGRLQWQRNLGETVHGTHPAILSGILYVSTRNGSLYALDIHNQGALRWRFGTHPPDKTLPNAPLAAPAAADGRVYVGSHGGFLYALDAETGQPVWEQFVGGAVLSAPAVSGDTVYTGNNRGRCYALDRENGSVRWFYTGDGALTASPVVTDSTVYVTTSAGALYALDRRTGTRQWTHTVPFGSALYGSAAIPGDQKQNRIYLADSTGRLSALETGFGTTRWQRELPGPVFSGVLPVADQVYVTTGKGHVLALSMDTGRLLWYYDVKSVIRHTPVIHGRTVYVGTGGGRLYALRR